MKYSSGSTMNLKLALLIFGVLIALGTLIYTQNLVKQLQQREKEIVRLYADGLEFLANPASGEGDLNFVFQKILQRIEFPMILTDKDDVIVSTKTGLGYKNIPLADSLSGSTLQEFLNEQLANLKGIHEPILVKSPDNKILSKIYYGDSEIISRLRYYPYVQIIIAVLFVLIAYLSFSYVKRSEQSKIWVGMSKETAHQLGTPISSLMGWNEILKMNYNNPDKVLDTSEEIESDLNRLNKITKRFSKIGSLPELKEQSVVEVIEKVVNYFQRRLPQLGKTVQLTVEGDKTVSAKINSELFEWVIENLIKNALDAIEHNDGKIVFSVSKLSKGVEITATDNGKGIETGKKNDVFRPGYSTKKRGWGLGLSLSKRIINDYHKGKIFVKNSVVNQGTTFAITLKG